MIYHCQYPSPVGTLLLTSDGSHLTGLWMDAAPPMGSMPGAEIPVLLQTRLWLDAYFRGQSPDALPPLKPEGTAFQRRIWRFLLEVPFGQTVTYGGLARRAAAEMGVKRMSAQAVGGAVSRNPISILIPCHRCLGSGGQLTGYAGGLERKRWLLSHEGWKGTDEHDHQ